MVFLQINNNYSYTQQLHWQPNPPAAQIEVVYFEEIWNVDESENRQKIIKQKRE